MTRSHWQVGTYKTHGGGRPVDDWIRDKRKVPSRDKAVILHALKQFVVREGTRLGRPHGAPLRSGLHELRVRSGDGKRHYRIIYFQHPRREKRVIVVLGIVKKSGAISKRDMDVAIERMRDWQRRHSK